MPKKYAIRKNRLQKTYKVTNTETGRIYAFKSTQPKKCVAEVEVREKYYYDKNKNKYWNPLR
jgi:hypothetical protein